MIRAKQPGLIVASLLTSLLLASSAHAEVKPQDSAAARELFELGRKLAVSDRFAEACPKFEESQKLDPGAGTMFHLADCYEHTDRPASAWALFLEVASQSAAAGRADRAAAAKERAAALRPKLPQMTLVVAQASDLAGLVIKRDGTEVGRGSWGTAVPVDPGKHEVQASAPGRRRWSATIDVPAGPGTTELPIPVLEPAAPGSQAESVAPAAAPASGSSRKTLGLVVGGTGLIAFGASIGLAAHAKSKFSDTSSLCDGNLCTREGAEQRDSARSEGNVATIVGGIGLAALAAGTVLYLTAPKPAPATATMRNHGPVVAVGPTGFVVRGEW